MSGVDFDLTDDNLILSLNSPRENVGGPYTVVYKDLKERWALVTMDWDDLPGLGMRWFWGGGGNPFSSAHPTWLVVPSALISPILNGLGLSYELKVVTERYLRSEINGIELQELLEK